jgi:hypothetical protein
MSREIITEARELCEKATPGEWKVNHLDDCFIEPRICEIPANGCYDYKMVEANSMFIARSRTLIPELCDALEKAEAQIPRWVPVAERLPACEKGAEAGPILYRMKTTGTVEVGYFGRNGRQRDSYFRHIRDSQDGVDSDDVTHWMPLPAPANKV